MHFSRNAQRVGATCDLISAGPLTIDIIAQDGGIKSRPITQKEALDFLAEAEAGTKAAGFKLHQKIDATSSA